MPEAEADFPRGGAPTLTPLEVRKIRADAEKDVLFSKVKFFDFYFFRCFPNFLSFIIHMALKQPFFL